MLSTATSEAIEILESSTFSGRRFTREQIKQIVGTVDAFKNLSRSELALTICEHFDWKNKNGSLKINSCFTLFEKLERQGLIVLPASKQPATRKPRCTIVTVASDPKPLLQAGLDDIGPIMLRAVATHEERRLFGEYIQRYHYLGNRHFVGQTLRYFLVAKNPSEEKLGCVSFAPAVFRLKARDQWLGWKHHHRIRKLQYVIENKRFLIFPWVDVQNLASKALSLVAEQVVSDWQTIYGVHPVLMETFVNPTKFSGISYQAANWHYVGETDPNSRYSKSRGDFSPKDIYVYPLHREFREILTGKRKWPAREKVQPTTILTQQTMQGESKPLADMWLRIVTAIAEIARKFDETWQKRRRVIDSLLLTLLIFRMVASKSRLGYGSIIDAVWDNCAKVKIALPQHDGIASSSLTEARKKLDEAIFKEINARMIKIYQDEHGTEHLWHRHRVFAVDGTKINLPVALLGDGYSHPTPSSHYPQGMASCLYDVKTMIPFDFGLYSHKDERRSAREHFKALKKDDVVVYDRGYFSYHMLHRHHETGIHAIFRLKKNQWQEIKNFWMDNQATEKEVTFFPEGQTRRKILRANPDLTIIPLGLRVIKYQIDGQKYLLGTTMLDAAISACEFQDMYHERWKVEELYKVSKQTFAIEQFHAKTERGVKQELFAHFALITMNRIIAHHADRLRQKPVVEHQQTTNPATPRQTNFKLTIGAFYASIETLLLQGAAFMNALAQITKNVIRRWLPARPGRKYPRRSFKAIGKWVPMPAK